MSVPIETDVRYKVNQEKIDEMRRLYKKMLKSYPSKRQVILALSEKYNISYSTVWYWLFKHYREYKQGINAKRNYPHGKRQTITTRRLYKTVPEFKLAHDYYSAKSEKRCKRHMIHGKTIKDVENFMKKFRKGGQKVF